jgi:hypothetical protein
MPKYSITTYLILLQTSSFKYQESDTNNLFFDIIDSKNDSEQFDTKIYEWIYNELTLVNEYRKYATEIKEKIINFSPLKYTISNSINNLLELINTKGDIFLEKETQNVTDRFLEELYIQIVNHSNERLLDFYENKIVKLKLNTSIIKKKLSVKIQTFQNDKEKQVFIHFLDFLKEYNSNPVSQIEVSTFPKTVDWSPFTEEVLKFYLYIESKFGTNNKSDFSAYWECIKENELISKTTVSRIKQRYIDWINYRFGYDKENQITQLQTNLSADFLDGLDDELFQYEKKNGKLNRHTKDINNNRKRKNSK